MFIEKSLLLSGMSPKVLPIITDIVNCLLRNNARVYAVGGAVRDTLLGLPIYDLDIEVHGVTTDELEKLLSSFGQVHYDGKSFGVFRVGSLPVDWSVPRRDSSGRKPVVICDPTLNITHALKRRDLTINAMAVDMATGQLIDPFEGYADLKNKVLAPPDGEFFVQDPLRFYRVMQFIGRFEMVPTAALDALCARMDISTISAERIHAEWDKLVMLSARPSRGIYWLKAIGRLHEVLPELAQTVGVLQEPDWHPEGDVFEHTMQVCDAAAERPVPPEDKKLLVYAALCHDLGKVTTTKIIDGRLRSLGHDRAGVIPARALSKRVTGNKKLIERVACLVRHHMAPVQLVTQRASPKAYKKLAKILAPELNLYLLAQLAYADKLGRNLDRNGPCSGPLPLVDEFIARADDCGVLYEPEKPLITGTDLMPLGFTGPSLGRALENVYDYQLEQKNPSYETLLRYAQRMVK